MIERYLSALERRFGRLAIGGTPYPLVFVMGLVGILELVGQRVIERIEFNRELILQGQLWRIFTFLFVPPSTSPFWLLFALAGTYFIATSLERAWGAFRYELYLLLGWATAVGCGFFVDRPMGNGYLLMSLMLAFGTLFPDVEFRVMFIIPVKAKWIALLDALTLMAMIGVEQGMAKLLPVIVMSNYLLFFHRALWNLLKGYGGKAQRARAFQKFSSEAKYVAPTKRRTCSVCGITDEDRNADIRLCACDRCKSPTEFCLKHAKAHLAERSA